MTDKKTPLLGIAAVERETRLSKDVLRAWEKRYAFPAPERDANGERCYPADQVERLRLMKRLMDQGYRPGHLAQLPAAQLAALPPRHPPRRADGAGVGAAAQETETIDRMLATVKHDPPGFGQAMRHHLARQGLERFVQHLAAPLTTAVGRRWEDGSFEIFDEHFYTEETARVLRQAIAALPRQGRPHVLLTTLPGEAHGLGLLMAEALLTLDGAACVSLGTETPLDNIVRAAAAYGSNIVALSFSAAYPRRQIAAVLQQLRHALPSRIALWAGGAGIAGLAPIAGVDLLPSLESGRQALALWRDGHKPHALG